MVFIYITTDGKRHKKVIPSDDAHREERLEFIGWLEFSKEVTRWW